MSTEAPAKPEDADPRKTPEIGASPDVLRAFLDLKINYRSLARTRRASVWTKAAKYREAQQWLEPSFNRDPTRTPHWSEIQFGPDDDDAVPTPTQPEIFVHLSNEAARLGKPEFEPYVRPESEKADISERTGAKLAEKALQHRLAEMDWEEIEAQADMEMPMWGQSILESWWETDSTKTTRIPVTSAKACPRHPKAIGPKAQPIAAKPQTEDPDAAPPGNTSGESTDETAPDGSSVAERTEGGSPSGVMRAENLPSSGAVASVDSPMAAEPEQPCDFVTCKQELGPEELAKVPPEVLSMRPIKAEKPEFPGQTRQMFEIEKCPTCEDHPPLVDFYPNDKEAAEAKDYFNRPLGEDKPLGNWRISNVSPHDLFPQSMGEGIGKCSDWQWWAKAVPEPISTLAKRWKNGIHVRPENSQAIMEWHPIGGERSIYESDGGEGIFHDFAREKSYHEKPSPRFPHGRSIVMAGTQVLLDSTFMVPSQTVPGEFFERVHLELVPWERRAHGSWGLSMSELLFSLQESINESRSMDDDLESRMGIMMILARNGMNLDSIALESGGYSGKILGFDTDPMAPNAEPKAIGGEHQTNNMTTRVQFFIDAMGRISGSSEPETGAPSGSPWSSVALQFQAEKSGERRANRMRRKRKALERLYSHGLKLMYHRCLEPRKLKFKDTDGEFKEQAWKGLEINGQTNVKIDAESEHDTAFQKQQKLMDALDKQLYDLSNPAVRDKILDKLELPRDIDGQMEIQRSAANREWCEFRDGGKEPQVDESIDDPNVHHDQHGLDIQSETFRDMEDEAGWYEVAPFLSDWWPQFQGLDAALMGAGVQRSPLLEHRILSSWDYLLSQRGVNTSTFEPERIEALRKVMRFRAHYEAHKKGAEMAAMAAQAGAAQLAAPGAEETQSGTTPTPGQPAVAQPGTGAPQAQPQPTAVM